MHQAGATMLSKTPRTGKRAHCYRRHSNRRPNRQTWFVGLPGISLLNDRLLCRRREKTMVRVMLGVILAALISPMVSHAQEMPARKPGLWEMQMSSSMAEGHAVLRQCIDERTDSELQKKAMQGDLGGDNCKVDGRRVDSTHWEFQARCQRQGISIVSQTQIAGDLQSAYQMDSVTRLQPPLMPGMAEVKSQIHMRYLGQCPADIKPGDTFMNGRRIN
ncbi:MAG: hypothetical protein CGU29_15340 [Candidatus Dactylopiibacterium carminicum]|uniref:DUF3617 domain-containing protein n=2 Tax=Candidatus Dactylopiibacterium carminicum TaxID=857335 RepID=A0A272ENF3_9RHOO|nr:DUF3617 domain-containing protein [Candidatus Dactylopiibacterium carminicum]PAS91629.1 MAG: hypothetical protein CGU29_15340 [Candidatus Dactylopiibacterium carminicum]